MLGRKLAEQEADRSKLIRSMKNIIYSVGSVALVLFSVMNVRAQAEVEILRMPHGGIQPRMEIGPTGTIHLIFFRGNAMGGNVFYSKRDPNAKDWSKPTRVNHLPDSAVAAGTIRGPQMALGRNERVHVAWMGSGKVATPGKKAGEHPKHPMLYTRLTDEGNAFEPERDLLTWTAGLDGGGTVAADNQGHVYVAWHGRPEDSSTSEFGRVVYVTHSDDDGSSFKRETQANPRDTGACGCCGMRGFTDSMGRLHLLYRMANEAYRDMGLLVSEDRGQSFSLRKVSEWPIQACPMSSASFGEGNSGVLVATETEGRVEARIVLRQSNELAMIPGILGDHRKGKHPSISTNREGSSIFAWSEDAGWKKGGKLRWQAFDIKGELVAESDDDVSPSIPEWSFAATATKPDGNFLLIY